MRQLVREQPSPTPYTGRNLNKDGRIIDVQVDWAYKRDEEGRVIGFVCILSDITERRRMEEAIRYQAHHDLLTGLPTSGISRWPRRPEHCQGDRLIGAQYEAEGGYRGRGNRGAV